MNPVGRLVGRLLQLVGISSPEDTAAKAQTPGPPSWRDAKAAKSEDRKQ